MPVSVSVPSPWTCQLYVGAEPEGALEMSARSVTVSFTRGWAGLAVTETCNGSVSGGGSTSTCCVMAVPQPASLQPSTRTTHRP